MATPITRQRHTIDATNKAVGRLATEIADKLRGKIKPTYEPHVDNGDFVTVENITKVKFTGSKTDKKMYFHHSGYPGGLKETNLKTLFEKNPGEVLRKAVWNMLPKNKLRQHMIKRLTIS